MPERKQLKDIFDRTAVERIAARVAAQCNSFDQRRFVAEVSADLPALELKARAMRIAQALRDHLPGDYPAALSVLLRSLGPDDGTGGVEGLNGFLYLPFLHVVGTWGLDHVERSLDALQAMTRYFSAEFDIRPYIVRHPAKTLRRMRRWSTDPDWRVRRLASEGSRPRLPWGMRLQPFIDEPAPVLRILERLKADPHEVVRRSVANNLNDIAKDNPDAVIETARRWMSSENPATHWIVRHGLRTLIKQGHPRAMALLGFSGGRRVALQQFRLARRTIQLGQSLDFSFELLSTERKRVSLCIDYCIHHRRANGSLSPKVFKLAKRRLEPGGRLSFSRRHKIVPITTRRYYPGLHQLEVLVNGRSLGRQEFHLRSNAGAARG